MILELRFQNLQNFFLRTFSFESVASLWNLQKVCLCVTWSNTWKHLKSTPSLLSLQPGTECAQCLPDPCFISHVIATCGIITVTRAKTYARIALRTRVAHVLGATVFFYLSFFPTHGFLLEHAEHTLNRFRSLFASAHAFIFFYRHGARA